MESYQSRRAQLLAFWCSLFTHAVILFLFLTHDIEKKTILKALLQETRQKDTVTKRWAATKARASQFGAPVIFVTKPEIEQEPMTQDQTDKAKNKQPEIQEIEEKEERHKSVQTAITQETTPSKTINQQKKMMQKIAQKMYLTQKIKQLSQTRQKQPPHIIQEQKKRLTLAQLTQGFLEHLKDEGNHRISTIGEEGRIPTAEQLKYQRYAEKLSWCLQNSFKINQNRFPLSETTQTTVEVLLTLNKNGSLRDVRVIRSSNNPRLDQFTLFIFRDASSSFPPVPNYLPHDPYRIIFLVEINNMMERPFGLYMS